MGSLDLAKEDKIDSTKFTLSSRQFGARLVSASFGSIITALTVTPLEVVKVRQQAGVIGSEIVGKQGVSSCSKGCGAVVLNNGLMECALPKSAVPFFNPETTIKTSVPNPTKLMTSNSMSPQGVGTFHMIRLIFRAEGMGGIYSGLSPTLVMSVPNTVLYFTGYDVISSQLKTLSKEHFQNTANSKFSKYFDNITPLIAGSSARLLATFFTSPLEMIRTRQARGINGNGMVNELYTLLQREPTAGSKYRISRLYRGLIPTLWRDVPFSAIYWLCLEKFRVMLKSRRDKTNHEGKDTGNFSTIHATDSFLSGALAGMIAAACTTPFDVIKTRQQISLNETIESRVPKEIRRINPSVLTSCDHGGASVFDPSKKKLSHIDGTFAHIRHIAKTEGVRGLWAGNTARLIKVAPACAIMITCYDLGKQVLE